MERCPKCGDPYRLRIDPDNPQFKGMLSCINGHTRYFRDDVEIYKPPPGVFPKEVVGRDPTTGKSAMDRLARSRNLSTKDFLFLLARTFEREIQVRNQWGLSRGQLKYTMEKEGFSGWTALRDFALGRKEKDDSEESGDQDSSGVDETRG